MMINQSYEKYSVLMSVYSKTKKEEFSVSVDSMLNQTCPPEQFILVLDGSVSDEMKTAIADYEKKCQDTFTIVPLSENHGLAYALNQGISVSRNELIARMDSDDYSLPERCEFQLAAFSKDEELALLGTNIGFFKGDPSNVLEIKREYPTDCNEIKKVLRRNDPFSHPSVMYKKSVVLACGGYDSSLRRRQDYDLFSLMVVNKKYKAANLPETLLLFRVDDDYHKRNKSKESCKSRIAIQKRIYKRGDCSILDYLYIWFAMRITMILPDRLYRFCYSKIKSDKKATDKSSLTE